VTAASQGEAEAKVKEEEGQADATEAGEMASVTTKTSVATFNCQFQGRNRFNLSQTHLRSRWRNQAMRKP